MLFCFILVLCVSHYVFFSFWNIFNKPITDHKFFEYNTRVEYVSNCFHKLNASVCGDVPTDLEDVVARVPLGQRECNNRPGLLIGGEFHELHTDFESIEKWCFHSL